MQRCFDYKSNFLGGVICTITLDGVVSGKSFQAIKAKAKAEAVSKTMDLLNVCPVLNVVHPHSITRSAVRDMNINVQRFIFNEINTFAQDPTMDNIVFDATQYGARKTWLISHLASILNYKIRSAYGQISLSKTTDYIEIYHYLKTNVCEKYNIFEPE